jgi:hypothetical protein
MAAPLALGMLARGGLELLKYGGAIGIPGLTFGLLSQPKEYEKEFDYDFYDSENPRFYDENLITEDNPRGFNRPLFLEAMVQYHKTQPMY